MATDSTLIESGKVPRKTTRQLFKDLRLYAMIAVPADICFFLVLKERPGPNGYVGVQAVPFILMLAYINAAAGWLTTLLLRISADSRQKQSDQVSI